MTHFQPSFHRKPDGFTFDTRILLIYREVHGWVIECRSCGCKITQNHHLSIIVLDSWYEVSVLICSVWLSLCIIVKDPNFGLVCPKKTPLFQTSCGLFWCKFPNLSRAAIFFFSERRGFRSLSVNQVLLISSTTEAMTMFLRSFRIPIRKKCSLIFSLIGYGLCISDHGGQLKIGSKPLWTAIHKHWYIHLCICIMYSKAHK